MSETSSSLTQQDKMLRLSVNTDSYEGIKVGCQVTGHPRSFIQCSEISLKTACCEMFLGDSTVKLVFC